MGNEAIIADGHHVKDEAMGLYPASVSEHDVRLDFDERTDETIIANGTAIEIGWPYHRNVLAERNVNNANILVLDHLKKALNQNGRHYG
jgi:hypothetical protein